MHVCMYMWFGYVLIDILTICARVIYKYAGNCKAHWRTITRHYAYKLYMFKFTIVLVIALQ